MTFNSSISVVWEGEEMVRSTSFAGLALVCELVRGGAPKPPCFYIILFGMIQMENEDSLKMLSLCFETGNLGWRWSTLKFMIFTTSLFFPLDAGMSLQEEMPSKTPQLWCLKLQWRCCGDGKLEEESILVGAVAGCGSWNWTPLPIVLWWRKVTWEIALDLRDTWALKSLWN